MNINFEQKQDLASYFIQCYIAARQGLTQLGILRSERTLQGDYAEWLVAGMLNLQLSESTVQKGYDATDASGRTYQIKSRFVKPSTSFDFGRPVEPSDFDFLVCVFFSPDYEVVEVFLVPCEVVRELGVRNTSSFRFRWNKRTASDPRIKKVY